MNEPTLVKRSDGFMDKQKKVLIIAIFLVVTLFIGSSYALLSNFDTSGEVINFQTGNLSVTINNSSSLINNELNGKLPENDSDGLANATPITITITNNGTLNIAQYDVKLVKDEDTSKVSTLDYNYIKYAISLDNGTTYQEPMNLQTVRNIIYTDYNLGIGQSKTITLKLWLDENGGNNVLGKTFYGSIDVKLYQKVEPVSEKIMAAANSIPNCTRTVTDTDGTVYISGKSDNPSIYSSAETDSCVVDFNYVWYSGKMWRVVAIYPDGSMKLVTEDAITAIYWGSDIEYNGSWVYQWLNEDFYDTLVETDDYLIKNASWNYSTDENETPVNPSTIETQKTTNAAVGLLNAYEYAKGYTNGNNYLNIGYFWWLITPYSSSDVRCVNRYGYLNGNSPASYPYGVRPSIYLKSGISMKGTGTKIDPYKINDNSLASAKTGDLLNSRMSGEYVKFENDLYRIVSTENDITKLTRVDYLRDNTSNETVKPVLNKNFASTVYFGKTGNTETDTFWDYYLNNTWYDSISSDYQNMMVDGTFYLGLYPVGANYKQTICSDAASNLDNKVVKQGVEGKSCTRYPTDTNDPNYDVNKIFTGKVGLLRVGEMFSSQLGSGYSSSSSMWLITPYSSSVVVGGDYRGYLNGYSPASGSYGVRPSINLASGVTITGGTGLYESPYEIEYTPSP